MPKVVLITGCTDGGIGESLAHAFLESNWIVIATARKLESMSLLSNKPNCYLIPLDVCNQESVNQCISQTMDKVDTIDVLINNAGVPCIGVASELMPSQLYSVFNTNVCGVIRMIQAVTPIMKNHKDGLIINIGSVAGLVPTAFSSGYGASKTAVLDVSETFRHGLKLFGIKVCHVYAGAIKSNFGSNAMNVANLPVENSIFYDFEQVVKVRASASQFKYATPSKEFANALRDGVVSGRIGEEFWYGRFTTIFWVLKQLPVWMMDLVTSTYIGIPKVAKVIRQRPLQQSLA